MTRDQLRDAGDAIVKVIVAQAEKRLDGQVDFANAQDARAGAFVGASVSLAAAALAVAAGAATIGALVSPLSVGAALATLGFSLAAFLGLWGGRACNFHSAGWYPNDFADDVADKKAVSELEIDFALDLQFRLAQNRTALIKRGNFHNAATITLLATPLIALVGTFLAAGAG